MEKKFLSVKDINYYIKSLFSEDQLLSSVWIKGEISNYKLHSSGHMYFTLKDEVSGLKCVMFRSRAQGVSFQPAHGMEVLVNGYISVYERDGQYQLYVEEMFNAGYGMLNLAYEQLKERLRAEGLFEQGRKRKLPFLPKRVGIVTSPTSAAIQDMISVLSRRCPQANILIFPAIVQGQEGGQSICNSLEVAYQHDLDVIIVGRGGGSLEELWCFNTEEVVRKIGESPVPIVSAVGHETDFTLADFIADVRAATPSMAAELVVPVSAELATELSMKQSRLLQGINKKIIQEKQRLHYIQQNGIWYNPERILNGLRQDLDWKQQELLRLMGNRLDEQKHRLNGLMISLDALSPLKVLSRGFAVCTSEDDKVIRNSSDVDVDDVIKVKLEKGQLECLVKGKNIGQ